jgi:hypothetical protein
VAPQTPPHLLEGFPQISQDSFVFFSEENPHRLWSVTFVEEYGNGEGDIIPSLAVDYRSDIRLHLGGPLFFLYLYGTYHCGCRLSQRFGVFSTGDSWKWFVLVIIPHYQSFWVFLMHTFLSQCSHTDSPLHSSSNRCIGYGLIAGKQARSPQRYVQRNPSRFSYADRSGLNHFVARVDFFG